MNSIYLYRIARYLFIYKVPFIPKLIYFFVFLIYNSSIPYSCSIGKGTKFGYGGMGVVIHARARIGSNCIISQQVTIGGRSRSTQVPVIGDNVYIGAGAKILGDVTIGSGSVIGANAVVISDVPSRSIVVGVPAHVVKTGINVGDYI